MNRYAVQKLVLCNTNTGQTCGTHADRICNKNTDMHAGQTLTGYETKTLARYSSSTNSDQISTKTVARKWSQLSAGRMHQ